ncbi:MAG TPA: hypothetical protein VGI70_15010 [Polyangiales bacterium]
MTPHAAPCSAAPTGVAVVAVDPAALISVVHILSAQEEAAVPVKPGHLEAAHAITAQHLLSQATRSLVSCVQAHVVHSALNELPLFVFVVATH